MSESCPCVLLNRLRQRGGRCERLQTLQMYLGSWGLRFPWFFIPLYPIVAHVLEFFVTVQCIVQSFRRVSERVLDSMLVLL